MCKKKEEEESRYVAFKYPDEHFITFGDHEINDGARDGMRDRPPLNNYQM